VHGGAQDADELVRAARAEAGELDVNLADGGAAGAARELRRDGSAEGAAQAMALSLRTGRQLETEGYVHVNFVHIPWIIEVYAWMPTVQKIQVIGKMTSLNRVACIILNSMTMTVWCME
jgi:hypothetical protein